MGVGLDTHKTRIDSSLEEPLFTICTKDLSVCHDYIFYTSLIGYIFYSTSCVAHYIITFFLRTKKHVCLFIRAFSESGKLGGVTR